MAKKTPAERLRDAAANSLKIAKLVNARPDLIERIEARLRTAEKWVEEDRQAAERAKQCLW